MITANRGRRVAFGAALMVLATVAAYLPSLSGSFLWDDDLFTDGSPAIRDGRSPLEYWTGKDTPDYYPLLSTSFWIQWQAFGDRATGYRVVTLLLHVSSCLLLWRLLSKLRLPPPAPWFGSMLFALHPVGVASVAWIAEQKNTMSMLFLLGAALAYLRFDETGARGAYIGSLALFACGVLSKASIVVLPAMLAVLVVRRRGRVRRRDMTALLPMFLIAAVGAVLMVWFHSQHATSSIGPAVRPEGLASRIAASGWVMWFYLYKVLLPIDLMMIYPRWAVDGGSLAAWLPLAAMLALVAGLLRSRSAWLVPLACYLIAIFPVLGLIDIVFHRMSLVADHWVYVGMPAVTAAVAVAVVRGVRHGAARGVVVGSVCLLLLVLTWQRSAVFHDSVALWTDNIARNPAAPVAYNNLGNALAGTEPQRAVEQFRRAIELNPGYAKAHYNLGFSLAESGRLEEAAASLTTSVSLDPSDVSAQRDLGRVLMLRGDLEGALRHLRLAEELDAGHTHVRYWLGVALSTAGRHREAVTVLRGQAERFSADGLLLYHLGTSLLETGEFEAGRARLFEARDIAARTGNARLAAAVEQRLVAQ